MYGKHRWTICCSGHDFWASAHYLLQVAIFLFWCGVASADFTSTDATNLRNCRRLLSELACGDPDTIDPAGKTLFDRATDIYELLRYTDFAQMADDVHSIAGQNIYLANIEANTESAATTLGIISDKLEVGINVGVTNDLVAIISNGVANALAAVPMAYAVATNRVDMGVVTNLAEFLVGGSNLPYTGVSSDNFARFFAYMYGISLNDVLENFEYFLANSPFGFITYLWASALLPRVARDPTVETSWPFINDSVWVWSGAGSDWEAEYTIFDAYNTLGLGVLTNQAASLLSVARANTNLLMQIHSILGDSRYGVKAIVEAVSSASDALETSREADLDYSANYDLPQWEPTYSREVDSNTNVFEFDDAMAGMMQSMLGDTTNQTGSLASNIGNIQSGGDLSLAFDFSGFNLGSSLQNFAPWSVSTSFAGLEEFKNFFKTLSRYMFYILDLCLVIIGCRRIQRAIIGDVGIL